MLRWLDMLGLDPGEVGERLVLTPTCGLAGRLAGLGAAGARPAEDAGRQPHRLTHPDGAAGYRRRMTDLSGKNVAIIATDFFEEAELVTPRDALRDAGAEVRIYSTGTDPIQAVEGDTTPTQKVDVDGTLDDLDVSAVDAVVVPGGTVNADRIRVEDRAQAIAREALDAGKPLAVICHGPWLLVSAGLVEGRRLTSYHSLADDVRNAGGTWVDEEVVVDGTLITSRDPDDLPAFVKALEDALAA